MEGIRHHILIYKQKETAPTSYYLQDGSKGYLPERVCINRFPFAVVKGNGRGSPVGQFKATFKKNEESIYKLINNSLHSSIYKTINAGVSVLGTGDIKGTDDLLVFVSRGGWAEIEIHIFPECKFKASEILTTFK